MRDEAAGRDSILKRFGLLRNAKEKFSDESSGDEDSEEDDEGSDFSSGEWTNGQIVVTNELI